MSQPIIEFRNFKKAYRAGFLGRPAVAVKNLDLSVPAGCIYGFLGANGAGKTTSIKVLMGLQFADAGEVKVFGLNPQDPAAKQRIGYLPERPYFHDSMDANAFLNFHRNLFGALPADRRPMPNAELLALVGLSDVGTKSLKSYSKGMLQRMGIAQALVNDPDLVVLDEPMSGLDPVGRREMRDILLRLHGLGKTLFFSSHILSDVEEICDRIAFLEKGSLKHELNLSDIASAGERGFELLFTGAAAASLDGRTGEAKGNEEFSYLAKDQAEVKRLTEEAFRQGAMLRSCHPRRPSLEEFLFGKTGEKR